MTIVLQIFVCFVTAICGYLAYTFNASLSTANFVIFIVAVISEKLIFRNLIILVLSTITFCKAKKTGEYYKIDDIKGKKDIKE